MTLLILGASPVRAEPPLERLQSEGELIALEVTTAPFTIARRYKSMEGPSVSVKIKLQDLEAAGGKLQLNEAPPLNGGNITLTPKLAACGRGTELWWFRAAKIEVLQPDRDEPSAPGFLCHFNLDGDYAHRVRLFPTLPGFSERILIFTSSMTDFVLPEGHGIPVGSEESWRFSFQALNHNLDGRHSFRHRVTLYFSRHRGLNLPLRAVTWTAPFVAPPMDGASDTSQVCPCCGKPLPGLNAPKGTGLYRMKDGRTATGHWVVPPGKWTWSSAAREFANGFDLNRELVAAWVHIHPFTERMTLKAFDAGCTAPREVWIGRVRNAKVGVGMEHIDTLSTPKGVAMPATSDYELEVEYNNTSNVRQDAMAVMGLYLTAPEWRLPGWALVPQEGNLFCGVPHESALTSDTAKGGPGPAAPGAQPAASPADSALFNRLPFFAGPARPDDPSYVVEMATARGALRFRVKPQWAPKTAAALKPLFARNLYANRDFVRADSGFVVQGPELAPEQLPNPEDRALLCRLPAEPRRDAPHRPGVLSMAMWPERENSATSSFSFVLGQASHLDGRFTVFAEMEDYAQANAILEAIVLAAAKNERTAILSTRIVAE